jgi:glycosyltransferase involved in cell wall biosynthesis
VVQGHDCGITVSPDDADGAAQAIRRMRSDPALLERFRQNARASACRCYDQEGCVADLLAILKPLCRNA